MFDSSISKEQADFLLSREQQGGFCCIAYGKNAAIAIVEWLYKGKPLNRGALCSCRTTHCITTIPSFAATPPVIVALPLCTITAKVVFVAFLTATGKLNRIDESALE